MFLNGISVVTTAASPIATANPQGGLLVTVIGAGTVYLGGPSVQASTGASGGGVPVTSAAGLVPVPGGMGRPVRIGEPEDNDVLYGVVAAGSAVLAWLAPQ